MQDARLWKPFVGKLLDPLPLGFVPLAASPEREPPKIDRVVAESTQ